MSTDGGIAGCELVTVREFAERFFVEVDLAKDIGVGGAQRGKDLFDTAADEGVHGRVGRGWLVRAKLDGEALKGGAFRGVATVEVHDGVTQQGIKPRNDGVGVAQLVRVLQRAQIRGLQDVFCKLAIGYTTLDEAEKGRTAIQQRLQAGGHQQQGQWPVAQAGQVQSAQVQAVRSQRCARLVDLVMMRLLWNAGRRVHR